MCTHGAVPWGCTLQPQAVQPMGAMQTSVSNADWPQPHQRALGVRMSQIENGTHGYRDKEKAKLTFSTPGASSNQLCGEMKRETTGLLSAFQNNQEGCLQCQCTPLSITETFTLRIVHGLRYQHVYFKFFTFLKFTQTINLFHTMLS